MKKIILVIIIFLVVLLILTLFNKKENQQEKPYEKRAVFISYIELQEYIKGKNKDEIIKSIKKSIQNIRSINFNMIILQVRSFSDAIYESKYFPWSSTVSEHEGNKPPIDILNYFIKEAHKNNIEIHAWINPYRVRLNDDVSSISTKNMAYKWLNTNNIRISDKGIYYNPASSEVVDLITVGVEELLKNYQVDGIHYDDYFYIDDQIDLDNYNAYIKENNISLRDYRLMMVNNLIEKTKELTTKYNVLFGISPDGNNDNNYNSNYADIYTWVNNNYIDYIMPQIYYGFNNEVKPFYGTLKEWEDIVKNTNIKLMPALALYKSGNIDTYAKAGINEWLDNDDILMRQILVSRNINNYSGFSIFRYDYLFHKEETTTVLNEVKNIKKITT